MPFRRRETTAVVVILVGWTVVGLEPLGPQPLRNRRRLDLRIGLWTKEPEPSAMEKQMATIQFVRGEDERTEPTVSVTRSVKSSDKFFTGTATFWFDKATTLGTGLFPERLITGMYLEDEEGVIITTDVHARFEKGKPVGIQSVLVLSNPTEWHRFMRFMNRYAMQNGLSFSPAAGTDEQTTFRPPRDARRPRQHEDDLLGLNSRSKPRGRPYTEDQIKQRLDEERDQHLRDDAEYEKELQKKKERDLLLDDQQQREREQEDIREFKEREHRRNLQDQNPSPPAWEDDLLPPDEIREFQEREHRLGNHHQLNDDASPPAWEDDLLPPPFSSEDDLLPPVEDDL